jgi:hypothetical protein
MLEQPANLRKVLADAQADASKTLMGIAHCMIDADINLS